MTKALTPMAVSRSAQEVLAEFLARSDDPILADVAEPTPWHINCGLCEDFAESVKDRLGGPEATELSVIWLEETLMYDDEGPSGFDHGILERLGCALPTGHPEEALFEVFASISHAVLVFDSPKYGVRFYDSQAIQGVDSYFDLPSVQDALGILDDPEVKRLQAEVDAQNHDQLNQAAEVYFRRCRDERVREYQAGQSHQVRASAPDYECQPG